MQIEQQQPTASPSEPDAPATSKPLKAPKRAAVKRPAKPAAGTATDAGAATGDRLVALAKSVSKVKGASAVASLAAKLAKGTLNHTGLVSLRDAVNALVTSLREADQQSAARKLAVLNRSVRRLERGGRAK